MLSQNQAYHNGQIDRYVLHELALLNENSIKAYDDFAFNRALGSLTQFCSSILSSFYFEIIKDSLYADSLGGKRRQAVVWTLSKASLSAAPSI